MALRPISINLKVTPALVSSLMAMGLCAATTPALTQTDETVKIGVLLGFTGPIESLTPPMADSAELAFEEISDSGQFLGGKTIESTRADSTCIDAGAATAAAERLVTSDKVVAILGA